jgi:glycosyltransferase involved in cell wall biosynthesis
MRFMFGLPTVTGWYDILVTNSILNQHAYIIEGHHQLINRLIHHTLIGNARNQIAHSAVENKCDYLFFIDSDVVIPPDALKRLVAHNKDIVSGMYFHKQAPFYPVAYMREVDAMRNETGLYNGIAEYPKDTLIEVDAIGMGCCLIKTDVFKNFIADTKHTMDNGEEKTYTECYAFEPLPPPVGMIAMGEDMAFCKRCQDKGYKIYLDTGLQCKHQTVRYIDEEYYEKSMQRIKAAK